MQISNKDLRLYIIMLLVFLCLILTTFILPLQQDEGVFLTIAEGLKNGLLPYRDFFDHKPPGIYFIFGILSLATKNIFFYKFLLITSHLVSLLLIFLISQKIKISGHYTILFYLCLILIFEGQRMIAEPFGVLFLLLSLYVNLSAKKLTSALLTGFLLGVSILIKQTFLLSAFAFLVYFIWQKKHKKLPWIITGTLIPIIVTILWLWASNILPIAYEQIILYNFKFYPSENIVKVIRLLTPSFLYTLPIWLLSGFAAIRLLRRPPNQMTIRNFNKVDNSLLAIWQIRHPLVLIALLATLPIFLFFGRHYPHYWLQVAPFFAIIASATMNKVSPSTRVFTTIFLIIFCIIFTTVNVKGNYSRHVAEKNLSVFLRRQNTAIYAENQFTGMYFLTGNQPPNKYLYITEISDWSEQAEEKTIETIKDDDYLVIWPADSNYAYAKKLQSYVLNNYKPVYWDGDLGVVAYKTK
ncbi:MAG: hypothetical protein BWY19_00445 [bacterium ADurb.Bin212]|nr:MAG: hypothetical protein BWY19_00445 [bacterium ADurb.Bin212]